MLFDHKTIKVIFFLSLNQIVAQEKEQPINSLSLTTSQHAKKYEEDICEMYPLISQTLNKMEELLFNNDNNDEKDEGKKNELLKKNFIDLKDISSALEQKISQLLDKLNKDTI